MKSFRFRFIILGLLLCIYHVWCRTCGTVFTDPASSTYLAQIVIEGTVSQKLPRGDLYSVRVYVKKVRKGDKYLPKGKRTRKLIIGDFSEIEINEENCITSISSGTQQKYFFFLKNTTSGYVNTAFPAKSNKKTSRAVRKLACRTCDKAPTLKTIKVRKVTVGRKLQISCRIRSARPAPNMLWEKNGQILVDGKDGYKIRKTKRGIVLRKRKASFSDSGTFVCEARNVVGKTRQEVVIKVKPNGKKNTRKPKSKKTTPKAANPIYKEVTTIPQKYYECPIEHDGKCFNGGTCEIIADLGVPRCRCPATHQGKRCEYRKVLIGPVKTNQAALKKDRTLTIIGIVIGVLVFVCICIASYVLANKRRNRFFRRQAEKRQQNEKNKNIPPSYSKLPSLDEVSEVSKFKLFERITMNHRETQTDETTFLAPNPHTNMNLNMNPRENDFLKNADLRRNSRTRLSGISDRRKSQPDNWANQGTSNGTQGFEPENTKPEVRNENSIPRIPKFSEADASSDDEKNILPPLQICEQEQSSPLTRKYNGICANSVNSSENISPKRDGSSSFINPTVTYTPPDTSQTLSSSEYSSSSAEHSSNLSENDNSDSINFNDNDNDNYNDSNNVSNIACQSWNERGSPELVQRPKYRRSSNDTRKSSVTNQNEMYSQLASTSGAEFNIYDLRDDDAPSIPV